MKILVTGDSHTGALARGLKLLKSQDALPEGIEITIKPLGGGHILPTPFFRDAGSYAEIIDPLYIRSFRRLPPQSMQVDAIGLSMPLWPMRLVHQMVWQNLTLAAEYEGRKPVSYAVYSKMVLVDQRYVLDLCALLSRAGVPVVAVSGPGLFSDHATLKHLDPEHVLHIFDTYRTIMKAELLARKIPVIDVLEKTIGEDGFMRPEFRHEDPEDKHHANSIYGAEVLRALAEWAQGET